MLNYPGMKQHYICKISFLVYPRQTNREKLKEGNNKCGKSNGRIWEDTGVCWMLFSFLLLWDCSWQQMIGRKNSSSLQKTNAEHSVLHLELPHAHKCLHTAAPCGHSSGRLRVHDPSWGLQVTKGKRHSGEGARYNIKKKMLQESRCV
jgi:hypothetical protein